MEPLETNPKHTKCTFSIELDLKGNIPGFVVKKACTDQGYQIVKMRKAVPKKLQSVI